MASPECGEAHYAGMALYYYSHGIKRAGRRKEGPYRGMQTPISLSPNGRVRPHAENLKEYALIVAESTAPLEKAKCIAWERSSLFFVGRAAAPESGQAGKQDVSCC